MNELQTTGTLLAQHAHVGPTIILADIGESSSLPSFSACAGDEGLACGAQLPVHDKSLSPTLLAPNASISYQMSANWSEFNGKQTHTATLLM